MISQSNEHRPDTNGEEVEKKREKVRRREKEPNMKKKKQSKMPTKSDYSGCGYRSIVIINERINFHRAKEFDAPAKKIIIGLQNLY